MTFEHAEITSDGDLAITVTINTAHSSGSQTATISSKIAGMDKADAKVIIEKIKKQLDAIGSTSVTTLLIS